MPPTSRTDKYFNGASPLLHSRNITLDSHGYVLCNISWREQRFIVMNNDLISSNLEVTTPALCHLRDSSDDAKGEAMYVICVVTVFAMAIGFLIGMLSFKKKKYDKWDRQAQVYLNGLYQRKLREEKQELQKRSQTHSNAQFNLMRVISAMGTFKTDSLLNQSFPRSNLGNDRRRSQSCSPSVNYFNASPAHSTSCEQTLLLKDEEDTYSLGRLKPSSAYCLRQQDSLRSDGSSTSGYGTVSKDFSREEDISLVLKADNYSKTLPDSKIQILIESPEESDNGNSKEFSEKFPEKEVFTEPVTTV